MRWFGWFRKDPDNAVVVNVDPNILRDASPWVPSEEELEVVSTSLDAALGNGAVSATLTTADGEFAFVEPPLEVPPEPEGELSVESLFLPFGVSTGPVDHDDLGWVPTYTGRSGSYGTPRSNYDPWLLTPAGLSSTACREFLIAVNKPNTIELCGLPKGHTEKHGHPGVIYAHPKPQPDPIIVGVPPQDRIRLVIKEFEVLKEQIEALKREHGI